MAENKHHIVSYRLYFMVLLGLLTLTLVSVGVTYIDFGAFNAAIAVLIASVKASLVLWFFMHLKFDQKIYNIMAGLVFFLFSIVLTITLLDYLFR